MSRFLPIIDASIRSIRRVLVPLFSLILAASVSAHAADSIKWVFTSYPPANDRTVQGTFSGFFHDIVIEAFQRRLGLAVDIAEFPWKRCQAMVKNGTADMMITIPTPERLAYAVTHKRPIWTKRRILYTYHDHPRMADIDGIKGLPTIDNAGYSVVSYLGNGWVESSVKPVGIPVLFATTVDGMYRMLAAKRGDLIIEEERLATRQIHDLGLTGAIVPTRGIASESGFFIMIGKRSPYAALMPRLEATIEKMRAEGEIERILARYGVGSR